MSAPTWSIVDHMNNLCSQDDIGKPKPVTRVEPPPPAPDAQPALPDMSHMTDSEIAATAVRVLRVATMEVFGRLGSSEWLYDLARSDPKNFLKMLQRLLPQAVEATVSVQSFDVPSAIRELTVEDLRAMRAGSREQPIDVEFTEVTRP